MKKILFLLIALSLLCAKSNIETKIDKAQSKLESTLQKEKNIHSKLDEIGEQVIKEEKELEEIKIELEKLQSSLKLTKEEYDKKNQELEKLNKSREELIGTKTKIEKDIIEALADNLSFEIIKNSVQPINEEDFLNKEIFESLTKVANQNIKDLKSSYDKVGGEISKIEDERKNIQEILEQTTKAVAKIKETNKKQERLIASLNKKKSAYNKELEGTKEEHNELSALLLSLEILKTKEEEEQKKEKQKKDAKPSVDEFSKSDVRLIGSSYQEAKTIKYRGAKTIAPLDDFDITKNFGPYFDPIYKIRVFNESISMKPKEDDAKVKSVLDGKVIFAKEMPVLDKVVIIEHDDNMHTIYAKLSKIAPTIKTGVRVKKGYVIGRVDSSLTFEVTQKNYHINPLEIITF